MFSSLPSDSAPSVHPEEYFDFLLEKTPDKVYFKDRNGRFLRASRAVATYLDTKTFDHLNAANWSSSCQGVNEGALALSLCLRHRMSGESGAGLARPEMQLLADTPSLGGEIILNGACFFFGFGPLLREFFQSVFQPVTDSLNGVGFLAPL